MVGVVLVLVFGYAFYGKIREWYVIDSLPEAPEHDLNPFGLSDGDFEDEDLKEMSRRPRSLSQSKTSLIGDDTNHEESEDDFGTAHTDRITERSLSSLSNEELAESKHKLERGMSSLGTKGLFGKTKEQIGNIPTKYYLGLYYFLQQRR